MSARSSRLVWAFLVVGLFASGLAYWQSRTLIERELDARLQLARTEVTNRLLRQANVYTEVLRASARANVAEQARSPKRRSLTALATPSISCGRS